MNDTAAIFDQDLALHRDVERLLHHEARLLDTAHFAEWLTLFTADGLYWAPSTPGQTDPLGVPSIMYEDLGILSMRVRRLAEARALVMTPMPRTTHLVGNIDVVSSGHAGIEADAAFIVVEYHDGRQRLFSGRYRYNLRRVDTGLRIALKRVDLLDCDGTHGPITVPL